MRTHLAAYHRQDWLEWCRLHAISFSQEAIARMKLPADYMKADTTHPALRRGQIPRFSLEAFQDAIRDWILADAQVR